MWYIRRHQVLQKEKNEFLPCLRLIIPLSSSTLLRTKSPQLTVPGRQPRRDEQTRHQEGTHTRWVRPRTLPVTRQDPEPEREASGGE